MKKIIALIIIIITLTICLQACNSNSETINDTQEQIEKNEDGKYATPNGKEYEYCLELTGTMPGAAKATTMIVYTNDEDLTFEKASKSLYSSNSNDSLDIYFNFVETE